MNTTTTTEDTARTALAPLTAIIRILCENDCTERYQTVAKTAIVALRPSRHDMGRIIGKRGETVEAIQEVAEKLGGRAGINLRVVVAEPEGDEDSRQAPEPTIDTIIDAARELFYRTSGTEVPSWNYDPGSKVALIDLGRPQLSHGPVKRLTSAAAKARGHQVVWA